MGAGPVPILTPAQGQQGAVPGWTLSSAPSWSSAFLAPWLPGNRVPEASLCLPAACPAPRPPPRPRDYSSTLWPLDPTSYATLGVDEAMDKLCSLDRMREPDIPVQPMAPRAQGGCVFIHALICSESLSTYLAGWLRGTEMR